MSLLAVTVICAVFLLAAYRLYGGLLARLLRLDAARPTPAVALRDDLDFHPIESKALLNQHFAAIAAAGPIVGPILAGAMFGWLPALLWILLGAVLVGGVHDLTALFASIRHKARSIAEVVREHMSRRSYVLFLIFVWLALDYVIIAFTDITASSFVGMVELESGRRVTGAGIATSSILYLVLPVMMGIALRYTRIGIVWATVVFLPLVAVAIWVGQYIPLDLAARFDTDALTAQKTWNLIILAYCFVASIVPMWCLLQPRGYLGGYFLLFALVGGMLGLVFSGGQVEYPAFIGWESSAGQPLFPLLFITVACGACSGFHSIVASGTTSKQLRVETDARLVGYGAMLLEAMVAVVSLACVMRLAQGSPLLEGGPRPNYLYATGIGSFLGVIGIPAAFAVSFALMAFTTFVYDTLDVCTRLGRYIIEELTGWRGRRGKVFAAVVTVGVPVPFLLHNATDIAGNPVPVWRVFWELFGASNQLLAALTLIGVTVWLWRTRRVWWVFAVMGVPTLLMYVMSTWALLRLIRVDVAARGWLGSPVPLVAVVLVALAAIMIVDAILALLGRSAPPHRPAPAAVV